MVRVQSGKSSEVQSKTADVLRRLGFEKESNLLTSKQTQSSSMCLWCVTVDSAGMNLCKTSTEDLGPLAMNQLY